jgi:hypothetical protein
VARGRSWAGKRVEADPLFTGLSTSWHRFESAKIPEIAFRALLTQDGARELELARA